jgi:hypothetical protein
LANSRPIPELAPITIAFFMVFLIMGRAKRGPSRASRAAVWRVAVDAQVSLSC